MSDHCPLCNLVVAPNAKDARGEDNRLVLNKRVIHKDCLLKYQLSVHDLELKIAESSSGSL